MSQEYSRVSTVEDDDDKARIAASPASDVGKKLLKDSGEKQSFTEMVKEDFWSNLNFLCCGGYKQELRQLQEERKAYQAAQSSGVSYAEAGDIARTPSDDMER